MSIFSHSPLPALTQASPSGIVQVLPQSPPAKARTPRSTFWLAFWLAIVLIASKAVLLGAPESASWDALKDYQRALAIAAHQDVLFATVFGVAGQLLLLATHRLRSLNTAVWCALLTLGVTFAFYGVGSIWIFHFVGSPLTSSLLAISGGATHMWSSVAHIATPLHLGAAVGAPILFVSLVLLTPRVLRMHQPTRRSRVMKLTVIAMVLVWAGLARSASARSDWQDRADHQIAANPHWALMASFFNDMGNDVTARVGGTFPAEYLADFEPAAQTSSTLDALLPPGAKRPRNVIVVVIESCPTQHMSLYGSKYDTTPRLLAEARAGNALVFDNVYAHQGLTANSLVSISLSQYPPNVGYPVTARDPATPGTTLQQVLKPLGYRTACISSGDNDYLQQDKFLDGRGFDDVWDCRDLERELGCKKIFSWGVEDRCMVDGMLKWLDRVPQTGAPAGQPFYILGWTQQTHHPYETTPGQPVLDLLKGDANQDPEDYNNYLNCLRTADAQIGRLMDELRRRNLADDTMVIVTGDHGEAFGTPHADIWGHGMNVYEENMHVPLVVWNPRLFKSLPTAARQLPQIGAHVDLNPTMLDLLGLTTTVTRPTTWQGRSLFDPQLPNRAYFLASNGDYMLALREGPWKYVLNVTQGRESLYNLTTDPNEQSDQSKSNPDTCGGLRARLSAWVTKGAERYAFPIHVAGK